MGTRPEILVLVAVLCTLPACGGLAGSVSPDEPRSFERECREDGDCVFRPETPCECAPCGRAWRRAVSQTAAAELLTEAAAGRCAPPECEPCETEWLGTEPVCVVGQCRVRHAR